MLANVNGAWSGWQQVDYMGCTKNILLIILKMKYHLPDQSDPRPFYVFFSKTRKMKKTVFL